MKTKKAWAISGIGYAFIAASTMEMVRAKPDIADLINVVGFIIAGIGICFLIYTVLILSTKNKTNSIISSGLYKIVRHPLYLSGIILGIGLAFLSLSSLSQLIEAVCCAYSSLPEQKIIITLKSSVINMKNI